MSIDIVQRLRFDATRCEMQFSKGVAGNIEDAAAEIERLRAALARMKLREGESINDWARRLSADLSQFTD